MSNFFAALGQRLALRNERLKMFVAREPAASVSLFLAGFGTVDLIVALPSN